jgi:O-Antigen ligase
MMELVFLTVTMVTVLAGAPVTPLSWRLFAVLVFSVLQLHILPVHDFYLSIAFVSSFLLWPELLRNFKLLISQKAIMVLIALIFIQLISLIWAPDLRLGIRTLIYTLPFFLIAAATWTLGRYDTNVVYRMLGVMCVLMALEAAIVVVFRLSPNIEMAYWMSDFSGIFSGPNTIGALLDNTERNNVLDPTKSGGVFVNANIAAAYLGVGSFIAVLVANKRYFQFFILIALFLSGSVYFTGSKAGIMLAITLPLLAVLGSRFLKSDHQLPYAINMHLVIPACLVAVILADNIIGLTKVNILSSAAVTETMNIRLEIWRYTAQVFSEHLFLGQGFGGWQKGFQEYALIHNLSTGFPPHNTLIYLWSQSGLFAALLGAAFMYYVLSLAYILIKSSVGYSRLCGVTLGLVALWIFVHGMGENWGLLGDFRLLPLLAVLLGLAYAMVTQEKSQGIVSDRVQDPIRRKQE